MNTADLKTLLAVQPVSRAAFFRQLLAAEPIPPGEPLPDDLPIDDGSDPPPAAPLPPQPAATGFPA